MPVFDVEPLTARIGGRAPSRGYRPSILLTDSAEHPFPSRQSFNGCGFDGALDFSEVRASDVKGQARAYQSLTGAGMDECRRAPDRRALTRIASSRRRGSGAVDAAEIASRPQARDSPASCPPATMRPVARRGSAAHLGEPGAASGKRSRTARILPEEVLHIRHERTTANRIQDSVWPESPRAPGTPGSGPTRGADHGVRRNTPNSSPSSS